MKRFWKCVCNEFPGCVAMLVGIVCIGLTLEECSMTPEARAQRQAKAEQGNKDALLARAEAFGRRGVIAKHPKGFCFFYVGAKTDENETIAFGVPCPEDGAH